MSLSPVPKEVDHLAMEPDEHVDANDRAAPLACDDWLVGYRLEDRADRLGRRAEPASVLGTCGRGGRESDSSRSIPQTC